MADINALRALLVPLREANSAYAGMRAAAKQGKIIGNPGNSAFIVRSEDVPAFRTEAARAVRGLATANRLADTANHQWINHPGWPEDVARFAVSVSKGESIPELWLRGSGVRNAIGDIEDMTGPVAQEIDDFVKQALEYRVRA